MEPIISHAIEHTITTLTVVQGMATMLRTARSKEDMQQILQAIHDELQATREELDKICDHAKQQA